MGHTPDWVKRKYEQAIEERYTQSRERSIEGFNGLMLLVDSFFNKGKGFNDILPPFAEVNKKKVEAAEEKFVGGSWWKSE